MDYHYAYLILTLILGCFWLVIFLARRDLHKAILVSSLVVSIFGLSEIFFYGEYWTPQVIFQIGGTNIGIEDLLLSFFYGGIAAGLYAMIFRVGILPDTKYSKSDSTKLFLFTVIIGLSICIVLGYSTSINLIYISSFALIVAGLLNILFRHDLIKSALMSCLLMIPLTIIWYNLTLLIYPEIFQQFWLLPKLSGIFILRVPLEEIIWHSTMVFVFSGSYQLWKGLKLAKK